MHETVKNSYIFMHGSDLLDGHRWKVPGKLRALALSPTIRRAHADAMTEALRESVATKSDIARIDSRIDLAVCDITIRMGAIAIALFGALAAIRFFP
jgi:hypothetical protein